MTQIEAIPEKELAVVTPMGLLEMAVSQGADLDKLEKLMALQERWEANEARKAFVAAMAAFKSESIHVGLDKENKQYNSRYTSLSNLVNTITPFLSKHRLSADWDLDQKEGIVVTCVITHEMGHSKRVSMKVPLDTSGAKNPIQQIKSAITYAKVCTYESACGVASGGENLDDDGNGTSASRGMAEHDLMERLDWIANCADAEELKRVFKEAYNLATDAKDTDALKQIVKAKDKRKAEL